MLQRNALKIRRVVALVIGLLLPALAEAQSWSWDARKIGMGGSTTNGNLASQMIGESQRSCPRASIRRMQVFRSLKPIKHNSR